VTKPNQALSATSLQSPDDLEATYREKRGKGYQGYVANLSETCNPQNPLQLITKVQTAPNATDDSQLLAETLAEAVDFFSIGTNDLTQYTLAADRTNPLTAYLSDALHPAVLRLIQQVVDAAHKKGRWVGLCGELAGDPLAIPILIGLGLDELSMSAPRIPRGKQIIRQFYLSDSHQLAQQVLALPDARFVREMISNWLKEKAIG
jgi:phosphoenolpyruvate synthase/pyruvate phosphate dikinase